MRGWAMATKIEVRKHYYLNRKAIISFARGLRPKDFEPVVSVKGKKCPFCPGNEEPYLENGRYEENGKWIVRWINNKFPAFSPDATARISKGLLQQNPGRGWHEVILETPVHGKPIYELSDIDLTRVFQTFQDRIHALYKRPGVKYVVLFKNFGPESGATIAHEHSQVLAQEFVPNDVAEKVAALSKKKGCFYCKNDEMKSRRRVTQNKHFVAFTPYAPRFNNELWIVPRRHVKMLTELSEEELGSLATLLKKLLPKVMKLADSYNMLFFDAPKGKDMHFHIEICPRGSIWAGYEFLAGDYIISVAPEVSAEFYRR